MASYTGEPVGVMRRHIDASSYESSESPSLDVMRDAAKRRRAPHWSKSLESIFGALCTVHELETKG